MIERSILPRVDRIALTAAEYRQAMKECTEGENTSNHAGGRLSPFPGVGSGPYSANSALAP